jgi:hypothetical protein
MFDTDSLIKINDLRGRILRQEYVSPEELHAALALTTQNRAIASVASAEKKERAKPLVVASGDSLLAMMAANLAKKKVGADPTP